MRKVREETYLYCEKKKRLTRNVLTTKKQNII